MPKTKKVVLAYSGGLDTSCCVKWLRDRGWEVICFMADLGQGIDKKTSAKRAKAAGASKIYIEDLRKQFVNEVIFPTLKARALYEEKYYLATALGRPLIGQKMVEIAHKEGATAVAHGCTGKGNDQVRIEVSARTLDPNLEILAPVRDWEFKSREEEIDYCKLNKIPIDVTKKKVYSIDKNLWGISIECGRLEDPWAEPPKDAYIMTKDPASVNKRPSYIEIEFKKGIPVGINGKKMNGLDIIAYLNKIGGSYGIGRVDMVEDRLVGIKSREIYESPAAEILYTAHREIEMLVLDRDTLHFKHLVSSRFAQLVYFGLWFSPLRNALSSFIDATQEDVTGAVRLKLSAGLCQIVGRKSRYSRYRKELATYDNTDKFNHRYAEGFIKLWGLPFER